MRLQFPSSFRPRVAAPADGVVTGSTTLGAETFALVADEVNLAVVDNTGVWQRDVRGASEPASGTDVYATIDGPCRAGFRFVELNEVGGVTQGQLLMWDLASGPGYVKKATASVSPSLLAGVAVVNMDDNDRNWIGFYGLFDVLETGTAVPADSPVIASGTAGSATIDGAPTVRSAMIGVQSEANAGASGLYKVHLLLA